MEPSNRLLIKPNQMSKFKEYKINFKKGIDDLLSEHPWVGNSQGDHSFSDTNPNSDWMSYIFDGIDKNDQDAINREIERRKKHNQNHIAELKKKGEYLKDYSVSLLIKEHPLLDNIQNLKPKGMILDMVSLEKHVFKPLCLK